MIANIATVDSGQGLGARRFCSGAHTGNKIAPSNGIELKISHEELSKMIGTTRPRISMFTKSFREHGLIEMYTGNCLVVYEKRSPITWVKEPP